jgi:hypothetical protein
MDRLAGIKRELEVFADRGATLEVLDSILARKQLAREDREILWLYAYALIRGQGTRLLSGSDGHDEDGERIVGS